MANPTTEAQYLSLFWGLAEKDDPQIGKVIAHVTPEMFETEHLAAGYKIIRERYAAARSLSDLPCQQEMMDALGADYFVLSEERENTDRILRGYAGSIVLSYRKREQVRVLEKLLARAQALPPEKAHQVVDMAINDLMEVHRDKSGGGKPQTREEYAKAELGKIDQKQESGSRIILPYNKLHSQIGPLLPGDLVGISAYSNGGKSLFLANVIRWFVLNEWPCIIFPTEMRERWLSRVWAAHSRVPQMLAEREMWEEATEEQKARYRFAINDLTPLPWEVVNRPSLTAKEIISRATVLRRKKEYVGKPVVVGIDHMHRLDYGNSKAEFEIGGETRRLRDWAAEDQEGGIILVTLFQPRKPADELELYKPVHGYQIKGVSEVWNEMDIHLSPYRRWVKVAPGWEKNPMLRTPWGTPLCLYQDKHPSIPEFCKPGDPDGKLDDQHAYVKVDKRRTGGEGTTAMLEVEGPTGWIYELDEEKASSHGTVAKG